jgi:hypothetical protein
MLLEEDDDVGMLHHYLKRFQLYINLNVVTLQVCCYCEEITDGNDHHGSLDEFEDAFECRHVHVCYVVIELSTQNMVS